MKRKGGKRRHAEKQPASESDGEVKEVEGNIDLPEEEVEIANDRDTGMEQAGEVA
jgi:hypothetical protein